jgi:subtilisin family serine protease
VKRTTLLSILVLISMVLVALPASMAAEDPGSPQLFKVLDEPLELPSGSAARSVEAPQPEYGTWQSGPLTGFTWYRHDCVYFDSGAGQAYDRKVYCLGGRPGQTQDSSVWRFDPVTSAWSDTNTDMPVEASNYSASVLNDATGWGIYLVAGYQVSTDGYTDAVQVYYPASNTAVEVTTDPFPGLVGGTDPAVSGGQEVVSGILYYFGGWSSDVAPYTSVETWQYDPIATAGSRWSRIATADLSVGRGYIITAQVDGVIYAIGGDTYDGANLHAQSIVESLDTANLAAGWDDAGVADMPVACDEARAFGFDLASPYEFAGQIVTAGCGQWTGVIAESMLYDVLGNFWDQSFPDLNHARRNFGSAFIPDLGATGTPGMWVFGGLDGSSILDLSEYYQVSLAQPQVKLIPSYQEAFGDPGDLMTYTLSIWNKTGQADTFDISYVSQWSVTGPTAVGPVADNALESFEITVTIPLTANCLAEDTVAVSAVGQTNPVYTATADARTIAGPNWQVENSSGAPSGYWMADTCTDDYGTAGTCFYAGGDVGGTVGGEAYMFDIASSTWTQLPDLLTPVFGATAGYIDGKLYVAGGFTTLTGNWGGTDILQVYDLSGSSWSYGTPMSLPSPFTGLGGTAGGADGGKLYVLGGCYDNTCSGKLTLEYDPVADVWTQMELIPEFVSFHGGTVGEGRAYVAGDYSGTAGFYEFDIAANFWRTRANVPVNAGRKDPLLAVVPQGTFLWGGDSGSWGATRDSTWFWHRGANSWVPYTAKLDIGITAAGGGLADNRLWNFAGSGGGAPHQSLAYCIPPSPAITGLQGYVRDANTGAPLKGFVDLYDAKDASVEEIGVFADPTGYYTMTGLISGTWDIYAAMVGYGRIDGRVQITTSETANLDFDLPAPVMGWNPAGISETLMAGDSKDVTLFLSNTGTSGLSYRIDEIAPGTGFTPASTKSILSVPSGVDPQVYTDLAASPDGSAEILVVMAEQADLNAAYSISDWSARGQYVYNTLKATADRTQAGTRKYLDNLGIAYHSHISLNSMSLTTTKATVDALAAMPEVAAIRAGYSYSIPEPTIQPAATAPEALPWNITNIEADQVWSQMGVTGAGIVVANIDTGVQYDHPALVGQYRGNTGGGTFDHNYNWWDPRDACTLLGNPAGTPCDNNGHGTHTMGSIAGSDDPTQPLSATNAIGVAPGAKWIACKGCEEIQGWACSAFALLECADFMLAPWDLNMQNPDPDLRPHVINNSWGGNPIDGWYSDAVAAWRAAGIFPAFSGGNSGPMCETVHSPSDYYNAFATGAVDQNDVIASFSSRGPSLDGTFKPQVTAPGVAVRSSIPEGIYAYYDGTSMASPHTAGELALVWSAQPQLIGQVQLSEWLLMHTADPILDDQCGDPGPPNYVYGWGRINAYNAVSEALAYNWDVSWLDVSPDMGTVDTGSEISVTVNLDTAGLTGGACFIATLKLETNDPYQGLDVFVPVNLCVEALPFHYVYLPLIVRND